MAHYRIMMGGHTDSNGSYHANHATRHTVWTNQKLDEIFPGKFRKIDDVVRPDGVVVEGDGHAKQIQQAVKEGARELSTRFDANARRAAYETMKLDDLNSLAIEEGIDLQGATKKADVISAILLHEEHISNASMA